jgi:hypothetical protein
MTTCTTCAEISAATEPHVFWGGLAVVALAGALLLGFLGKYRTVMLFLLALIGVGIAVDVTAHGYMH